MQGRLEVEFPEGWKTNKPGEAFTRTGRIGLIAFAIEKGPATIQTTATGKGQRAERICCPSSWTITRATAPYFSPAIDGQHDDWKDGARHLYIRAVHCTSAHFWSRRSFSLLVAVEEDQLVRMPPPGSKEVEPFDAIQFAIAAGDAHTPSQEGQQDQRCEFLIAGSGDGGACYTLYQPEEKLSVTQKPRPLAALATSGAKVAVSRENGWTYYECSIPFKAVPMIQPDPGRETGFGAGPRSTVPAVRDWGQAAGLWLDQRTIRRGASGRRQVAHATAVRQQDRVGVLQPEAVSTGPAHNPSGGDWGWQGLPKARIVFDSDARKAWRGCARRKSPPKNLLEDGQKSTKVHEGSRWLWSTPLGDPLCSSCSCWSCRTVTRARARAVFKWIGGDWVGKKRKREPQMKPHQTCSRLRHVGPARPLPDAGCAGETRDRLQFRVQRSEDPKAAGEAAAKAAKAGIGEAPLQAVIIAECYEDRELKAGVLEGVCSVFGKEHVYGLATYGSFTQSGVVGGESVTVLVLAGKDIRITAACQKEMGASKLTMAEHEAQIKEELMAAGQALAKQLPKDDADAPAASYRPTRTRQRTASWPKDCSRYWARTSPITAAAPTRTPARRSSTTVGAEMLTDAAVGLRPQRRFQDRHGGPAGQGERPGYRDGNAGR